MALRIPPGRAGRTWLVARLAVGRRGTELLDRKREALLRERGRIRSQVAVARADWDDVATRALQWNERAALLDGTGRMQMLAAHVQGHASVELTWSNLMGAALPAAREVTIPPEPPLAALGGSSAAVLAGSACAQALRAAVALAVAQRAEEELAVELARTARRLRALRERWIPQHEPALAQLDLALDEVQREQAVRVRWLTQRGDR